jgi:hypothetical protein
MEDNLRPYELIYLAIVCNEHLNYYGVCILPGDRQQRKVLIAVQLNANNKACLLKLAGFVI